MIVNEGIYSGGYLLKSINEWKWLRVVAFNPYCSGKIKENIKRVGYCLHLLLFTEMYLCWLMITGRNVHKKTGLFLALPSP